MHDFIIEQEDAALLDQYLARFMDETGVRAAILMGRDGHPVAQRMTGKVADIESLCALSVGAFASSEALAQLAGEETFNSIFHQGVRCNVYITMVGREHLLLALFDYHASAPLVRLQAKVTAESVINVLERANLRTRAARIEA